MLCSRGKPDGKFEFGGTLVSNGDLFLNGNTNENHASNYIGNIHGSILQLKERYYVFYHRHTNRSSYARQACAEELVMRADGSFEQAEMTSCGLNGGPLKGNGRYEARIACNLCTMEEKRDDMIAGIPKRGLRNIRILRKIEKTEMRGRDSI
ncbi:hypothetical protein [Faecalimonas umbilicata]|uniref:hypothetical protein n=1 Tax=Faecalimonas umbilicata TaxID=1912855 RepID=UPI0039920AED